MCVIPAERTSAAGLVFVAEMYGVQLDQLAAVLGVSEPQARAVAARWRARRHAESPRLGPGGPWTWLTRARLVACGLPYAPTPPALATLAGGGGRIESRSLPRGAAMALPPRPGASRAGPRAPRAGPEPSRSRPRATP